MVWAETVSGLVGGAAGVFVTHPLDTVRIRAQAAKGAVKPSYGQIARDILKHRGVQGFFAGITPPVALRGIGFAVNRSTYGLARKYTSNPLLVGGWAGFWQGACECPIHLVKVRAQVTNSKVKESFSHYFNMFRDIVRTEKITGLFTGFIANSVFYIGSYGVFYLVYDNLREKEFSPMAAGPIASLVSWPIFYPFDVMRTRTQLVFKKTRWSKDFWTFRRVSKQLLTQHPRNWFPGIGLTLVRGAQRFCVAMAVCEETKKRLDEWD